MHRIIRIKPTINAMVSLPPRLLGGAFGSIGSYPEVPFEEDPMVVLN